MIYTHIKKNIFIYYLILSFIMDQGEGVILKRLKLLFHLQNTKKNIY